VTEVVPAGSWPMFGSDRLETPAADARAAAEERETRALEREQEDARINAEMDARIRAAAGRVPVQEQPPEDEAGLPADELRERQFQRAVAACNVLPEAVEDVRKLIDWAAVDADKDQARAVDKAVRALVARKPALIGVESADAGAGRNNRGRENLTMDQLIRKAAGREYRSYPGTDR
jgi:hypothetical protein